MTKKQWSLCKSFPSAAAVELNRVVYVVQPGRNRAAKAPVRLGPDEPLKNGQHSCSLSVGFAPRLASSRPVDVYRCSHHDTATANGAGYRAYSRQVLRYEAPFPGLDVPNISSRSRDISCVNTRKRQGGPSSRRALTTCCCSRQDVRHGVADPGKPFSARAVPENRRQSPRLPHLD